MLILLCTTGNRALEFRRWLWTLAMSLLSGCEAKIDKRRANGSGRKVWAGYRPTIEACSQCGTSIEQKWRKMDGAHSICWSWQRRCFILLRRTVGGCVVLWNWFRFTKVIPKIWWATEGIVTVFWGSLWKFLSFNIECSQCKLTHRVILKILELKLRS